MLEHSKLVGGSSADRVINCPGSVSLAATCPPEKSSPYAIRGSMLHKATEMILGDPDLKYEDIVGLVYDAEKDILREFIDDEDDGAFIVTWELINEKIEPAVDWFETKLKPDEFWLEQRLIATDEIPDAFGTADVVYRRRRPDGLAEGGVVDWKFGDGVLVPAENNSQMAFYLSGALSGGFLKGVDVIKAHIFQPAASVSPSEYASEGLYTEEYLDTFIDKLVAAVHAALGKDARLSAGDWCKWCPVNQAGKCPMLNTVVSNSVMTNLRKQASPDEIAEYLRIAEIAKDWIKKVEALALEVAEAGYPPPGYKLVKSQGHRKFADEKRVLNLMRRKGFLKKDIYQTKLKSVAELERMLAKQEIPSAWFKTYWNPNIERPETGVRLVRQDQKGEEVGLGKPLAELSKFLSVQSLAKRS